MVLDQIDLRSLRLFVAVCEQRNMGAAAAQENIEASAISKRMAQLERFMGAPLLLRSRRGVSPTQAGQALLDHARTALFTIQRAHADIQALSNGLKGRVRLLASAASIAQFTLDDVAAFMRSPENAAIQVDMEQRASNDLVRELREGSGAVGICWDTVDLTGLQSLVYHSDRLAIAVPLTHPLAAHDQLAMQDTVPYEHIGLPPTAALHTVLQRAMHGTQALRYRLIVSNLDTALRMVSANFGISVIPLQVGQMAAQALGVKLIPLTDTWAHCQFRVCFRHHESLEPAARQMVQYLASRAKATIRPA
jgi:DNA-binding transcriptional LysR family regulator